MSGYELKELPSLPEAKVDIVLVPGLGDSVKSWASGKTSWVDDLTKDLPEARILTFGYGSTATTFAPEMLSEATMKKNVTEMCSRLVNLPAKRPIIFVAHSFGGILCAEALVMGNQTGNSADVQTIAKRICGMVFLGTPIPGENNRTEWVGSVARIVKLRYQTDKANDMEFHGDCAVLWARVKSFGELLKEPKKKIQVVFFYEGEEIDGTKIVNKDSATIPNIGTEKLIDANHTDICRFKGKESPGYILLRDTLQGLAKEGQKFEPGPEAGIIITTYGDVGVVVGRQDNRDKFAQGTIQTVNL